MSPDTSELSAVGEEIEKKFEIMASLGIFLFWGWVSCLFVCVCVSNLEHGFSF